MTLIWDIETDGLLDEMTKIHCIVIKDTESGVVTPYRDGSEVLLGIDIALVLLCNAPEIAGHNICGFDIPAIQKLYPWFKPNGKVRDTLLISRLIWSDLKENDFSFKKRCPQFPGNLMGRHSLEAWGWRVGLNKGDFGKTADWKTFTHEMLTYCIQDVEVTAKFWALIESKQYSERAIDLEHRFAAVIRLQEKHGFQFDVTAAVALYAQLSQRRMDLERELKGIFPGWSSDMKTPAYWTLEDSDVIRCTTKAEVLKAAKAAGIKKAKAVPGPLRKKVVEFNPGSRDHIARALIEKYAWSPKDYGKDGKPTVDETVLGSLVYPEAKVLTEFLLLEKRIGQLAEGKQAWLKLEKKGRIHGRLDTNGAVTGRCTHKEPNMAQVPSCKAPYGPECRALFTAPDGYVLVGADASGLELRCLAHFMSRYDGGAYAKTVSEGKSSEGTDVHTINCLALGLNPHEPYVIDGKHTTGRDCAKTFIYAYLYGAGDEKIGSIVGKGTTAGKKLKASFLAKTPALRRLREDVIATVTKRGYLIGLDGRLLPIRSEHAALNTLLQSAGALIVKLATVLLIDDLTSRGWKFGKEYALVAHIHDELQLESKEEIANEVGRAATDAMRRAGEQFGFKCPIAGEYKIGKDWKTTH